MKKTLDEVIYNAEQIISIDNCTLLFGVTCVNSFDCDLTAIAATENDDVATITTTKPKTTTAPTTTTTAHVHNWVDVTETRTIHHDAEYATRTYWDKPCFYHGCKNLPESVFSTPGRYGDWMNLGWNDANEYMVPTFDLLLWKYGTPSNFPSYVQQFHSVEECDKFFGYSNSAVFCSINPMTGSYVPDLILRQILFLPMITMILIMTHGQTFMVMRHLGISGCIIIVLMRYILCSRSRSR